MKWISAVMLTLVLTSNVAAQGNSGFLHTPAAVPFPPAPQKNHPALRAGKVSLNRAERKALLRAPKGAALRLPSLDAITGDTTDVLNYRRIELFAPGAKIRQVDSSGVTVSALHPRHFFVAMNKTSSVGLAVDPVTGAISGIIAKGGDHLQVSSSDGLNLLLSWTEPEPGGQSTCGTELGDQPGFDLASLQAGAFRSMSDAPAGTALTYQAVIAIDADTEWMAGKGNDTGTAMTWITDLFLAMNVFYERDVEIRLLIGDVTLWIGPDPYSVTTGVTSQLNEFAQYWRLNMGALDRDFAAMFSGRNIASGSYSGIAWINQYCQKGFVQGNGVTVGSYSFHAIGTNRTPANTAIFAGHEFGHNMGSPHTHCYNPAVDQCYRLESGCYSGPVSCPAGGKGTVMSYCHFSGTGAAGCGTSNQEFHPTVQSLIESRLAANSPSCIAPFVSPSDPSVFSNGFEAP